MNIKTAILAVLVVSVFLVGCGKQYDTAGYATYNQQGQQQGQYVGGGCGVAPQADYNDVSVDELDSADSAL
ncbi:hypothetical protein J4204_02940 [Candidatus Woesearchaeota archaeon]|nr:hypothetical protein [Candidatus Woesearchaeota archaeon]